jgi:hypothetical protein
MRWMSRNQGASSARSRLGGGRSFAEQFHVQPPFFTHFAQGSLLRIFVQLGYDEKHATQVVERLLKGIRTRSDDDMVLKAL